MEKNNCLINSINAIARRRKEKNAGKVADQMAPQIYVAMAIAPHRTYGFGYDRINRVFVESQHIWEEFVGVSDEMIELCEKETGICVLGEFEWRIG